METIGPTSAHYPCGAPPAKPPVPGAASWATARPSTTAGSEPSPTSRSSSSTSPTASIGPVATAARHSAHPAGRRTPGAVRQQDPCGRARPHPRGRHERRAGHRLDGAGLPAESLGRVRLRLPRLAGPAARPGGSPPLGPGPLQRDALRRRVAPGPDDLAAGDRPAERPAGGLRPGRQQRPTPHAAVRLRCRCHLLRGIIRVMYQLILFGGLESADEGFPLRTLWPARVLRKQRVRELLAYARLPSRPNRDGHARAAHGEPMACALDA